MKKNAKIDIIPPAELKPILYQSKIVKKSVKHLKFLNTIMSKLYFKNYDYISINYE